VRLASSNAPEYPGRVNPLGTCNPLVTEPLSKTSTDDSVRQLRDKKARQNGLLRTSMIGAGDGIRTHDPNLGKVVLKGWMLLGSKTLNERCERSGIFGGARPVVVLFGDSRVGVLKQS
jgi:hypothetical protein